MKKMAETEMTLPSGTVTFLFTDIENSTPLWEKYPEQMRSSLSTHDAILKKAVEDNHGIVIKTTGDGIHAVFTTAIDAVNASVRGQKELQSTDELEVQIKVRMGIHTGEAELRDGDYFGGTLNRGARIMSAGHGGQILISEATLQLAKERLPKDVVTLDLGDHQLKGLTQPEKIIQISLPGLQQQFPPLKTQSHAKTNLPTELTTFVGRERELAEAASRFEKSRLLTLIGPGGTGKTRLSIQLGQQLISEFKDGVWLIELAPISDPSLILQAVVPVFDIGDVPGVPLKSIIHDFLREKHLVIILDNCEHLVEASALIAEDFLQVAPNIKIIASSREALGINGETVYRVPSLSLPMEDEVSKDALMKFEAVQLFIQRANAANRTFQLTDENASYVAQICSRLDGIPLAIELSASRVTVFSPEQIAKRLDDRFKLLTGGSRTALPRQQTLRALIDWSYDILSEEERALLRRLSVFAGGWTFEAAETICNNLDVFELLPQLVNKSLVSVKDEYEEPRYFLLETIRQYARDKLLETGEGEGTRNRHLAYFQAMAETAETEIRTKERELYWYARFRTEFDNIRTAIEWALSSDPFIVGRMLSALSFQMVVAISSREAHQWGEKALEKIDQLKRELSGQEKVYKARLLFSMQLASFSSGDNEASYLEGLKAIKLLKEVNDRIFLATSLGFLSSACILTGRKEESIKAFEDALTLAEEFDDQKYILAAVLTTGVRVNIFAKGDIQKSVEYQQRASELLKEYGNRWTYGINMFGFGNLYSHFGEFDKAREHFNIAMEAMKEIGSTRNVVMINSDLAHILRREGKLDEALAAYRETIKEWQRIGHRAAIAHQLECMAFIAKSMEDPDKALMLFGAAEEIRKKIRIDMTAQEREVYEKEVADLKSNIDEKTFSSRWKEGRSLTVEKAVEFAIA